MSIDPYAVINTMERCGSRLCISFNRSRPLRSGRLTSSNNKSKGCSPNFASPDSPVPALETPYPSLVSSISRPSRISDSSSTTRIEPLDMDRFPYRGELNMERSALPGCRTHIDFSGVLFDNAVAHRKTEARAAAAGFGGEERIENAVNVLAWNARAGIGNLDFDAAIVRGGAHLEHSAAGHSVARVEK